MARLLDIGCGQTCGEPDHQLDYEQDVPRFLPGELTDLCASELMSRRNANRGKTLNCLAHRASPDLVPLHHIRLDQPLARCVSPIIKATHYVRHDAIGRTGHRGEGFGRWLELHRSAQFLRPFRPGPPNWLSRTRDSSSDRSPKRPSQAF